MLFMDLINLKRLSKVKAIIDGAKKCGEPRRSLAACIRTAMHVVTIAYSPLGYK